MKNVGIPLVWGRKKWTTNIESHTIEVHNNWRIELFPTNLRSWGSLEIDGITSDSFDSCPDLSNSFPWNSYDLLKAKITTEQGEKNIHAIIGAKNIFFVGCKIFSNNELIGGDIKSRITDYALNRIDQP